MQNFSKTLNPLPFEHLEPHRFEDLVRQLIYDFREWRSIEATGRSGSDGGFDVRAWEIFVADSDEEEEGDGDEHNKKEVEDRLWLVQCKREKAITPKKIEHYAQEIKRIEGSLYGVIFAAPCNLSKKTRDSFVNTLRTANIKEVHLWGRSELEDMLFQPKNDHLLFAYFSFSLLIRRRSLQSQLRRKLVVKRKVIRYLGGVQEQGFHPILLRDVHDTSYPWEEKTKDFQKSPHWKVCYFLGHEHDGVKVLRAKFFAYLDDDRVHWDYVEGLNDAVTGFDPWKKDERKKRQDRLSVYDYWSKIPEKNRGWLNVEGHIPYEKIIEIDQDGDIYFEHPHLYLEVNPTTNSFEDGYLNYIETGQGFGRQRVYQDRKNRIKYFPSKFPKPKPTKT